MTYSGGYYIHKQPLVKAGMNPHTSSLSDPLSDTTIHAVNLVQETPWRINTWILDVMRDCWHEGIEVSALPAADDIHIPGRLPDDVWAQMSDAEKSEWRRDKSQRHTENSRRISKRDAFLRQLAIAERLREEPEIFFPHNVDFRTRMYPIPRDLNPQGDDVARGLLMFAEGKRVSVRGLRWLMIHLANSYGMDKLSLEGRVAWAEENLAAAIASAMDPIGNLGWWDARDERGEPVVDSPWVVLATCRELYHASETGPDHISHLPVQLDGSCNGLQHLSALGRDRIGAEATNVAANQERRDIYQQVADACAKIVANDVGKGVPEATKWAGKITRKTVKRAVMTTPYGVTTRGIRDQLVDDRHTHAALGDKATGHQNAANYLTEVIQQAMDETVSSASQIMGYLQDVAHALANRNIPLQWTNAAGSRIEQSYYRIGGRRITTLFGKFTLLQETREAGLDATKQRNGSAPNYIHSQDAAHLALSVVLAAERGVTAFSMIHDSYGCHAGDVDVLRDTLRETFAEMYSSARLMQFHLEQMAVAEPLGIELPEPPELGDFDISEVLKSDYFFA